jgi:hypothetical protein
MRGRLRWAAVGTYVVALVVVAFWPTPVDRPAAGLIADVVAWCHAHGLAFVSYSLFEQAANVALFVPLGAALTTLGFPATRLAAVAACMAVSVLFEGGQAIFLPDRFASPVDVLWNTVGGALGVFAAALAHPTPRVVHSVRGARQ